MGGGVQWLTIGLINKIRLPILYYASPIIEGETKWIHLNHSRSDGSLADIEPSTQRHWFQTSRQQAFSEPPAQGLHPLISCNHKKKKKRGGGSFAYKYHYIAKNPLQSSHSITVGKISNCTYYAGFANDPRSPVYLPQAKVKGKLSTATLLVIGKGYH